MEQTKNVAPFIRVDEIDQMLTQGILVWYNQEEVALEGELPVIICQVVRIEPQLILRGYFDPGTKIVNPEPRNFIAVAQPIFIQHEGMSEEEFIGNPELVEQDVEQDVKQVEQPRRKRKEREEKQLDDSEPIAKQMMKK